MLYILFTDLRRIWQASAAPGKRKQSAPNLPLGRAGDTAPGATTSLSDNLPDRTPVLDPSFVIWGRKDDDPQRPLFPPVPPPRLDPETRRKRQALFIEAETQSAALTTLIQSHHNTLQRRPIGPAELESFVHGIERIAEQAEADPSWFLRYEEFLGGDVYQTWRQMQAFVPPPLGRRLVRAYVRLAEVTQQNGAPLESQWAFYLLAYALDPRLDGAFPQAAQVADQLHLRTPEAHTLRLLARRSA